VTKPSAPRTAHADPIPPIAPVPLTGGVYLLLRAVLLAASLAFEAVLPALTKLMPQLPALISS
jgi:hypothetical protein